MNTGSVVKIVDVNNDKEVLLYHHFDGYIEGVGFDLLKEFYDIESKSMRTVDNYSFNDIVNMFIKNDFIDIYDNSYEYTAIIPSDIEYLYTLVYNNGLLNLTASKVNNWKENIKIEKYYSQNELINMYLKDKGLLTPIAKEQIKLIHTIYNKDLNWTHDRYLELLRVMFGVDSCKFLNTIQADALINTLNGLKCSINGI